MRVELEVDNTGQFDVFISHASINKVPVRQLVKRLKEEGFSAWFDEEQIVAGRTTLGQLVDGIVASRHMIVCLSDPYIEREWTDFELGTNQSLDPANLRNRTIPVRVDTVTRELPIQLHNIITADLADPVRYEREFEKIVRSIKSSREAARVEERPSEDERKSLEDKCNAALKPENTPVAALLQARVAALALCMFLYRLEFSKSPPQQPTLDILVKRLSSDAKLPTAIKMSLNTVQTYGNWSEVELANYDITPELVQPGLAALKVIADWTFTTYFGTAPEPDLWESILDALPRESQAGEYLIPGTDFVLKAPQLSLNSLGPLYAGRNKRLGEAVSINLVILPGEAETRFNEEVTQFFRFNNSRIIRPRDAGPVVVNNHRLCHFVAIEHINGVSGQDLVGRFGALPALAAFELSLGVALALVSFHTQETPIVHGDIKPANIIVDAYGQVKVLCIGRNSGLTAEDAASGAAGGKIDSFLFASPEQLEGVRQLTPKTDLFALRAMLFYLLTGEYKANVGGSDLLRRLRPPARRACELLESCQTATEAAEILEKARQQLGGHGLHKVTQHFRNGLNLEKETVEDREIKKKAELPPPQPCPRNQFSLAAEFEVDSRSAWALGDRRVLVWERGAGTLAILEGPELLWRDVFAIPIRHIVRGPETQIAVTSWEGHVRLFAGGKLVNSTQLRGGTIGDIQFCGGLWIAGTWQGPLYSMSTDGQVQALMPEVQKGVFRIAVAGENDLFAVADLSGGITLWEHRVRTVAIPSAGIVSSMAFAGQQLMVIANKMLFPITRAGRIGPAHRDLTNERARLLPGYSPAVCLLVTRDGGSWTIDGDGRHIPYVRFPGGACLFSDCVFPKRYTLALPDGGFAYYWQDNQLQESWAEATAAHLSPNGRYLAVTLHGKVLLYEDSREG